MKKLMKMVGIVSITEVLILGITLFRNKVDELISYFTYWIDGAQNVMRINDAGNYAPSQYWDVISTQHVNDECVCMAIILVVTAILAISIMIITKKLSD